LDDPASKPTGENEKATAPVSAANM
jgi:hypothetical protein